MRWFSRVPRMVSLGVLVIAATGLPGCARQVEVSGPGPSPAAARAFDPSHVALGPDQAEVGRRYPFDLYVHCSGEYTRFGGLVWHTDVPPGDPPPSPDADGVSHYTGYLAGWMTRTGPDSAVFEVDGRSVGYRRVADGPLCD